MDLSPFRRGFPLSHAAPDVRWEQGEPSAAGEMFSEYEPRLNYTVLSDSVDDLRLHMRKELGDRFPPEVNDRLQTLDSALNKVQLAESKSGELLRVQNALIEVKDALATIERHGLPDPELLTRIQIDLVRVKDELTPKNHGHDR